MKREVLEVAVVPDMGFLVGVRLFVESRVGRVGLFCSFAVGRSGEAFLDDILDGLEDSCSPTGMPTATGADEPENQLLSPPFDLSATLMAPSLSPVSVGMKSTSSLPFSFVGERCGLVEFVRVRGARKGSKAVNER